MMVGDESASSLAWVLEFSPLLELLIALNANECTRLNNPPVRDGERDRENEMAGHPLDCWRASTNQTGTGFIN